MQTANVLSYAQPIIQQRIQNALAERQSQADQYNALAAHGGPTRAAANALDADWSPYAIGGATRPDSFSGMTPEMQNNLFAFLQAADSEFGQGVLQVYSGYRSPELQAQLYEKALAKYGSPSAARKWVAPPGRSQHNSGNAADLKFNGARIDQADPAVAAWIRETAPRYGLAVPMSWEPWQVELAGARG